MNVHVKYCGGCNPKFNRTLFVDTLIDAIRDLDGEDIVLLVSGCESNCLKKHETETTISVNHMTHLDRMIAEIRQKEDS